MFVNSTPHRRFTQSLGWPLSTYEILDFTLEKYGHELSVNGSTPYLFSVEHDGTAMRLWFFNDSALYFHRLIKAFRAFSARKFFIFPLMTNAVFTQRCGLEPRQSHFMRNLRCGKHTCRMKALRFSKNKYHKNLSAGSLVLQNQRSGAFVISGGELTGKVNYTIKCNSKKEKKFIRISGRM